jgi:hypothetical protein
LVMVPSVMDSPIWGMTTSVGMNFSSPSNRYRRQKSGPFHPVRLGAILCDYTAVVRLLVRVVR